MLIMIDLDNTLADRAGAVDAWIARFVLDRGLGAEEATWLRELDNDGYSSRLEVFKAIKERFVLSQPLDGLLADYQADVVDLIRPLRGATSCLKVLRAGGWPIAIVTNGSTKQQNAKIDRLGFRSMVDAVVVSETLGIKKPDSGIFEHAATSCGIDLTNRSAANSWMIGDSALHDIAGAQAMGISTGWLPRGRPWSTEQPPPTLIIDDLTLLPTQLAATL